MVYKINNLMKKTIISLLFSIVYLALGYLVAFPMSSYFHATFNDTIFVEGILIIVITLMASSKKSLKFSIRAVGTMASMYGETANREARKVDGKSSDLFKSTRINSLTKVIFSSLTIIFGGVLLTLYSIFAA